MTLVGSSLLAVVASSQAMPDDLTWFVYVPLGFAFGLYLIYWGFSRWRVKRLIQDTPTEEVRSMAVGRSELSGVARTADETFDAPFTDHTDCLYVSWEVREHRKRHPPLGERRWATVGSGVLLAPFYLEDETGKVLVSPDALVTTFDISEDNVTEMTIDGGDDVPPRVQEFVDGEHEYYQDQPFEPKADQALPRFLKHLRPISSLLTPGAGGVYHRPDDLGPTSKKREYRQEVLRLGDDVYVYGAAKPKSDAPAGVSNPSKLIVRTDEATGRFIVSDRGEEALTKRYAWWGPALMAVGLGLSAVFLLQILAFLAAVLG